VQRPDLVAFARIVDLIEPGPAKSAWVPGMTRKRRALNISSDLGLGHVYRDLAIARETRALNADLAAREYHNPHLKTSH
jgi:hypothetical protein